jgi:hypothetical protein
MIAGLGGRDVTAADVTKMLETVLSEKDVEYRIYGVRG